MWFVEKDGKMIAHFRTLEQCEAYVVRKGYIGIVSIHFNHGLAKRNEWVSQDHK